MGDMLFKDLAHLPATLVYSLVGAIIFGLVFWVIVKIAPFSIRKEIEEDQNTSLGIIIGSIMIALAIIIAAAII